MKTAARVCLALLVYGCAASSAAASPSATPGGDGRSAALAAIRDCAEAERALAYASIAVGQAHAAASTVTIFSDAAKIAADACARTVRVLGAADDVLPPPMAAARPRMVLALQQMVSGLRQMASATQSGVTDLARMNKGMADNQAGEVQITAILRELTPLAPAGQTPGEPRAQVQDFAAWRASLDQSDWTPIAGSDRDRTFAIFHQSPQPASDGHRTMWVRIERRVDGPVNFRSELLFEEFDCAGHINLKSYRKYKGNNLQAYFEGEDARRDSDSWRSVPPGSVAAAEERIACR